MTPDEVRSWGKHAHGSPLYAHLVEVIAEDPELMSVLGRIRNLPRVNLLLGGVQALLFEGQGPDLARYYRSTDPDPLPPEGVGPVFRDFVLENIDQLVEIGTTRFTQTNECRRCVALLPLVMLAPFHRFHLIDIGTSAGLNLGIDRYHYRWGELEWGPTSTLTLTGESRGAAFPLHPIEVLSRIGLDLDPVATDDLSARRWLDALIWPEQVERRQRLRAAFGIVASLDLEMVAGDAIETLPNVLGQLPAGEPAVVMDSFSLNQVPPAGRRRIEEAVDAERAGRQVHRISMELLDVDDAWARLYVGRGSELVGVGLAHPHGEWLELEEA